MPTRNPNSQPPVEELYWLLLASAAGFICVGSLLLKERVELWWSLAGALPLLVMLSSIAR